MHKQLLKTFIIILILLWGCKDDTVTEPANNTPVIIEITADPSILKAGEITNLICLAEDVDGENLSYKWFSVSGKFTDGNIGSWVKWQAPQKQGTYEISVEVSDNEKNTTEKITVKVAPNFELNSIPPGEFTFGKENKLINIVYGFEIMKYEVTNLQYIDFLTQVNAEGLLQISNESVKGFYKGDSIWAAGEYEFYDLDAAPLSYNVRKIAWDGSKFGISEGYENHPVILVTWFGAKVFADYYGLDLPSEQEWEKVARGNTGYLYPWGNSIAGRDANFWNSNDPWERGTTPVGYYNGQFGTNDRPSPYGAYDIIGNVWEWTRDPWSAASKSKVLRGGGWNINGTNYYLRAYTRDLLLPNKANYHVGFRCIKY